VLSALAPARRRLVLGLIGLLLATAVTVAGIVVFGGRGNHASGRPPQGRLGPILLIPGYGGSTAAVDALAGRLRAAGRDARVVPLPGGGSGDLDEQANVLGAAVTQAIVSTGAPSVDLVGYSAGGVVARLWVREHGGAPFTRRVLTLGSPHHGTGLADLAGALIPNECPLACQQLTTNSPLLSRLNSGDETPDGPQWISVWTTKDQIVRPPDSARLDGALNFTVQSVCPNSTVQHGQLPSDPAVQRIVVAELSASPPNAPSGVDCTGA
jgi:triacylglycerol lipase